MRPKTPKPQTQHLHMNHPLVKLSGLIDWARIESTLAAHFVSERGRPALPPRLVAGLLYLQHTFDCSDELVVNTWVENSYWQFFTGETYLQTKSPIDPSSLTRWRKCIGEEGVETLLLVTIDAARRGGMLKEGLVVGMRSMPGNPWDGHALDETVEQVSILTDRRPKTVIVDKGYQGVKIDGVDILRSGQRRVTRTMRAMIHRRNAIEPAIGHMKMDGRLNTNPLKGALGDALHAVLCGAGHNMRMLLRKLRLLCAQYPLRINQFMVVRFEK